MTNFHQKVEVETAAVIVSNCAWATGLMKTREHSGLYRIKQMNTQRDLKLHTHTKKTQNKPTKPPH